MSRIKRSGRQAACQIHLLSLLVALAAIVAPVWAEPEIAQARTIANAPAQAKDLGGASLTAASTPVSLAQAKPVTTAAEDDEPVDLLGEFNVTALRRRVTERENTQTTYVVTRADIRASGATTVSDALKLVPSINFVDDLGGVDTTGFNQVRGLDDTRFVLLQDGRPLTRASNNRAANISKLPTINVERIEVVTGGSSLRYGADAIGGVINVITQIPEGPPKVTLAVNAGSLGFSQYSLDYSGSNGVDKSLPGYFGYQLGYERRSVLNNYNQTFTVNAPAGGFIRFASGAPDAQTYTSTVPAFGFYSYSDYYYGKVIFKPGKDHTVTVGLTQQNTRRGYAFYYTPNCRFRPKGNVSGGRAAAQPFFYCYDKAYYDGRPVAYTGPYDLRIDDRGLNVTWDWNLSELNTLTTQLSYNDSWENYPPSSGQRFLNNRTLEAQIRYVAEPYPGNNLNVGFQFLSNRSIQVPFIGAETGKPLPSPTVVYDVDLAGREPFWREISRWALYLTEDLKFFNGALITNFGSRLTDDVQFGTFTTSGVGFRYNFGSANPTTAPFGLRANWQQSFKAPGLTQLYLFSNTRRPNPSLVPETGAGYDIGLDVAFSPSALLRITHYRIDLTNTILNSVQTSTTRPRNQSVNAQATLATGWEMTFDWKIDSNWRAYLAQTFTDARPVGVPGIDQADRFGNPLQGGFFYGYQFPGTPWNNTALRISYASPGLTAALTGRYEGDQPLRGGVVTTPSYSTWDLTTQIPISSVVSINAGVFNIFNNLYQINPGLIGYNNPGTTFRVGAEATF